MADEQQATDTQEQQTDGATALTGQDTATETTSEAGQATEAKDDTAQGESEAKGADSKETEGETKEDNTEPPEDFQIEPPEGMEDFKEDFANFSADMDKWLKANPEASARDALAEAARRQAAMAGEQGQAAIDTFNEQVTAWENEAKADKEIGGAKYDENLAVARRALDAWGSDGLKAALDQSGLGSHPEMIRLLVKAGAGLKEPPMATTTDGTAKKSLSQVLYGSKG